MAQQVRKLLVLEGVTGQRQQTGITALHGRMAGDQPVREFKVKIVDVHVLYRHGSSREGKDTRHRKQDQKLFPFQEHKGTETIRFARC